MEQVSLMFPDAAAASPSDAQTEEPTIATPAVFSVSEITNLLKGTLESQFADVWVVGEVSGFRPSAAGHAYFDLKDDQSVLHAAIFRGVLQRLPFRITDGMELVCHGRVEIYAKRGSYQLILDSAEPRGVGALQLAFEQLKTRLQAEGLFERRFKIPLPPMPQRIGVVTSPTGAVIRDILHVVNRRFPAVHVLLAAARVQGDGAAQEIAQAIAALDASALCDVIVVARGGGSMEDLWAFNEEVVARAIFACRTPIVSAIGHEIDFTIADFVADVRAPTPSAAAELVVPSREELLARCLTARRQMTVLLQRQVERAIERFTGLRARMKTPISRMTDWLLQIDHGRERLRYAMDTRLAQAAQRVAQCTAELSHLSPLQILAKGYAVMTKNHQSVPIRSSRDLSRGEPIQVRLHDGMIRAIVEEIL